MIMENGFETHNLIVNNINDNVLQNINITRLGHGLWYLEILRKINELKCGNNTTIPNNRMQRTPIQYHIIV